MSDLTTIEGIFKRAGVRYEVGTDIRTDPRPGTVIEIDILAGNGPANLGYSGDSVVLGFDEHGNLLSIGSA